MFKPFANAPRPGLIRVIAVAVFWLAVCAPFAFGAAQSVQFNRVVAVVNGEMITMYDLQRHAMQEIMRRGATGGDMDAERQRRAIMYETLDSMVLDILIRQEAERFMVSVNDSEVDNELRMILQSNGLTQKELERQMAAEGSTVDELKIRIRNNILRQRMVSLMISRKAEVTPDDIEQYYKNNMDKFSTHSSVELSMIGFGPGVDAEVVRNDIINGALTFAEAAKQYSVLPNAAIGGQLGDIAWKDLNQSWSKALEGLKAGDVSPVLRSEAGAMLLHVDALSEGKSKSLAEVSDQIAEELREPKLRERYEEYTTQLRNKAVVDIRI